MLVRLLKQYDAQRRVLEGGDLSALLKQRGYPLVAADVRNVALRVLTGVNNMHKVAGMSHASLKPDNIGLLRAGDLWSTVIFDIATWQPLDWRPSRWGVALSPHERPAVCRHAGVNCFDGQTIAVVDLAVIIEKGGEEANAQESTQRTLSTAGSSLFQGNPAYACPEALRNGCTGERYDLALADAYSIGVTLFKLLTNELPARAPREDGSNGGTWSERWERRLCRWERCLMQQVCSHICSQVSTLQCIPMTAHGRA